MVILMFSTRKIAREILPLVVIAWATFVILGGAMKAVETGFPEGGAATGASLGLCAVSVAAVFGTGLVKRVRPAMRRLFIAEHRGKSAEFFAPPRPMAYMKPPPGLHPLRVSQVLRT